VSHKSKVWTFNTASHTISYKEGAYTVTVNGKSHKLSQKSIKIGSSLYVPLSFLKTTLGASYSYSCKTRITSINVKIDDPYKFNNNL
jgi:hypothetical protein